MHYLVTGHTGFKGSWLTMMLRARGHTVSGMALDPAEGALYTRAGLAEDLEHDLRVDIRDAHACREAVAAVSPDVVVHLAAQSLVRDSYRDPHGTWETNVMGTLHVLQAVQATSGIAAALIITTDKVYRNVDQIWGYRETDPLGGVDPYSASKAAADLATQSWILTSGCDVPTAIARAGNVIGGGDVCAERLMVDLVAAFSQRRPVTLRYPHAVRPWQHVLDCLNGYLTLVDSLLDGHHVGTAFNFGPGTGSFVEVGEVAQRVADMWGEDSRIHVGPASTMHEAGLLSLDSRKAELELGWHDILSFDEALAWTVSWARSTSSGASAREQSMAQVEAFLLRQER